MCPITSSLPACSSASGAEPRFSERIAVAWTKDINQNWANGVMLQCPAAENGMYRSEYIHLHVHVTQ